MEPRSPGANAQVAAGGRLHDRIGTRLPTLAFASLGVVLGAAGFVVPAFETLLFAWSGAALFVALVLGLVFTGPTLPTTVTTDVYTAMAGNAARMAPSAPHRYVPDAEGVTLAVGEETLEPVGGRLLASVETRLDGESVDELLAVVLDVLVNELELAGRASASVTDGGATVSVTGSRIGTAARFDHPIASVVGVSLADHLDAAVGVDTSVEDDVLAVACRWSDGAEELLDGPHADEGEEEDRTDE